MFLEKASSDSESKILVVSGIKIVQISKNEFSSSVRKKCSLYKQETKHQTHNLAVVECVKTCLVLRKKE